MAINDIAEYSHLTETDIANIGRELDELRAEITADLGEHDVRYIHNALRIHHALEIIGRLALLRPAIMPLRVLGITSLCFAKIIDNMELGHNIMHGQWDWMNDKEIHSSTWEWDNCDPSAYWKQTHNYIHHKYTNIVGVDDDIGYGVLRVTREQPWRPLHIFNVINNFALGFFFDFGVSVQHWNLVETLDGLYERSELYAKMPTTIKKVIRQLAKDYIAFPLLAGSQWKQCMKANFIACTLRNFWTHAVIFCGHFPDGAEKFHVEDLASETRAEWYLRQMLGSANFTQNTLLNFLTGNLNHQIEHHMFPDIPSNRYAYIGERVRDICERYDLPYTIGPFSRQIFQTWRTIAKLSLPNWMLFRNEHNAPETSSEQRFYVQGKAPEPVTVSGSGLRTALQRQKKSWKDKIMRLRAGRGVSKVVTLPDYDVTDLPDNVRVLAHAR